MSAPAHRRGRRAPRRTLLALAVGAVALGAAACQPPVPHPEDMVTSGPASDCTTTLRVAVIGDSIARSATDTMFGDADRCWEVANWAVSGSTPVAIDQAGVNWGSRINDVVATQPQVLVLSFVGNYWNVTPDAYVSAVSAGVQHLIDVAHNAGVKVVVALPVYAQWNCTNSDRDAANSYAWSEWARAGHLTNVDATADWWGIAGGANPAHRIWDCVHLDDTGNALAADATVNVLHEVEQAIAPPVTTTTAPPVDDTTTTTTTASG